MTKELTDEGLTWNGNSNIAFECDNLNREPIIRLCTNGDIFIKGKLAENDKQVVDAMREFLKKSGFIN